MTTLRRSLTRIAVLAPLVAGIWFGLRELRRAHVTFVPNPDATAAAVVGTVVDGNGNPVPGVGVSWFVDSGNGGGFGSTLFHSLGSAVITGSDGSFRFDKVPATTGYAAISDDLPNFEGHSGELTPQVGFVATELRLSAKPVPSTRRLRGKLSDPAGKPVAFAFLQVASSSWWSNWQGNVMTDAGGSFEIVGPWAKNAAEVRWQPDGREMRTIGNVQFGDDVQLVVAP